MSVAGMNRVKGDRCSVWRAAETVVNGSTERSYDDDNPVLDCRLLPLPITEEVARQIFGTEIEVDLQAVVPIDLDIREKDGIGFTSGDYENQRFFVTARRPLGRYAELALQSTSEWFPNPPDTLPEGVEP